MPKPRPWWARFAGYAALWTAVTAFFAVQVRVQYSYVGAGISWPAAFGLAGAKWYVWALLTPPLWWFAHRFPFERQRWARSALLHVPATLFITLLALLLQSLAVATVLALLPPGSFPRVSGGDGPADLNAALLTAVLISGICHALLHSRTAQERRARAAELESRLTRARLDLLRSQLQPHFLFNTLNAVITLMHRDVYAAETMVTRLADLLRLTLELRDRQEVTLRAELELTDAYLAIQQTRFGDRLRVTRDIDPTLYDALVPTMLLQPLVENAIDHGIGKRTGAGHVNIRAVHGDDGLRLVIRDDGPGLSADTPDEGIGLTNTRERLAQLYGAAARLRITSAPERGVEVEIRVPLRLQEGDAQ